MLDVLLKFCEAFFHRQQTLQSICLWVLRKKNQMIGRWAGLQQVSSFQEEYTWTNLFDLLQEHLQSWLDDLQVPPKLSHNILQGILQDHMLKVEVL